MNRNTNGPELSLQPQDLSVQPRAIVCPKCQHKRTANDIGPEWQCPNCGIAYNKAMPPSEPVVRPVSGGSGARGRRDVDRDDFDTATPSAVSLSLEGRIGRLRYLAFSWPPALLIAFLMLLALRPGAVSQTSTIVLVIVTIALWMWSSLRLMALRMHDINQSSKWLLGLVLLPGVFFALGKPQLGAMCSAFFWIVGLSLMVVPGTDGDNTYGPPPGPNTTLVKVGAGIILVFMALGVVGNVKMALSGKYRSAFAPAPTTAQAQSDSSNDPSANLARQSIEGTPMAPWIGLWRGPHSALRVDNLGNAVFFHVDGGFSTRAAGPLQILDENRISIGSGANAVILKLAEPPHMEGQSAKMMLDGVELVKG
jgi:uncharacterized membrane protein YhaH (DUF805 family)